MYKATISARTEKTYQIDDFARLSQVSVVTLCYSDEMDLMKKKERPEFESLLVLCDVHCHSTNESKSVIYLSTCCETGAEAGALFACSSCTVRMPLLTWLAILSSSS